MIPKGILIAVGGNEDKGTRKKKQHTIYTPTKFLTQGILWKLNSMIAREIKHIEIVTTASSIPEKVGKLYVRAFKKLGCHQVNIMDIRDPEQADQQEYLHRLSVCHCILFSGGDQFRLTSVFRNTAFFRLLSKRYVNDDFIIAGTSAGAMAMTDVMIYPGVEKDAHLNKEVHTYPGFGFLHHSIIDTHFLARGRFRRLAQAVAERPHYTGIGLEEDTGVIIREGKHLEVIGSGLITIVDATEVKNKHLQEYCDLNDIYIENLKVHLLAHGNKYTLSTDSVKFSAQLN